MLSFDGFVCHSAHARHSASRGDAARPRLRGPSPPSCPGSYIFVVPPLRVMDLNIIGLNADWLKEKTFYSTFASNLISIGFPDVEALGRSFVLSLT